MRTRLTEQGDRARAARQSAQVPPIRLDIANAQAWQGEQRLKLTPKALAVLQHLMEQTGRLVTKAELQQRAWADIVVTNGVLAACIRELRKALQDDAYAPQYIETVHRRGYRFIASLTAAAPPVPGSRLLVAGQNNDTQGTSNQEGETVLIGRDAELTQLHGWLDKARSGERQVVFVTGEPGIGKTSVVQAFVAGIGQPIEGTAPHSLFPGVPGGSALSNMVRESRTCPCWKRWGGCAAALKVSG